MHSKRLIKKRSKVMADTQKFIDTIAPLARAEYLNRSRWVLPSVCIAQAALESGWNLNAKTLFGIKGDGNALATVEYINGKYTNVTASFKAFPNIAAAVHGYYDLITLHSRYNEAVNNPFYVAAVEGIVKGGYATDPSYRGKIISIIEKYNLTKYDDRSGASGYATKSYEEVAKEVLAGKWGNGNDRRVRLASAGYDYAKIQTIVNSMTELKVNRKSNETVAQEVIRGQWGNGNDRRNRLRNAGYDPDTIQKIVNAYMR